MVNAHEMQNPTELGIAIDVVFRAAKEPAKVEW